MTLVSLTKTIGSYCSIFHKGQLFPHIFSLKCSSNKHWNYFKNFFTSLFLLKEIYVLAIYQ